MSEEKRQALEMLEQTRDRFLASVTGVPEADWRRTPSFGGWSPAEVLEHMVMVEASTAPYLASRVFSAPAPEEILARTRGRDQTLRSWLEGEEKATAPDFVTPGRPSRDREAALEDWLAQREAIIAAFRDGPEDLRSYSGKHPLLGSLDGFQWAVMVALHADRHGRQLRRIVADLAG